MLNWYNMRAMYFRNMVIARILFFSFARDDAVCASFGMPFDGALSYRLVLGERFFFFAFLGIRFGLEYGSVKIKRST